MSTALLFVVALLALWLVASGKAQGVVEAITGAKPESTAQTPGGPPGAPLTPPGNTPVIPPQDFNGMPLTHYT